MINEPELGTNPSIFGQQSSAGQSKAESNQHCPLVVRFWMGLGVRLFVPISRAFVCGIL
jgi:hypothetical protein